MTSFSTANAVSHYAENAARLVPGYLDLQTMAGLLLAEQVPSDARILVLGAGGGQELRLFAETHPGWQLDGIDPSAEMLDMARSHLGAHVSRVQFHNGYVDGAPLGPFDGATCILTLHFLSLDERRKTVEEVYRRLRPGAPFVVAHHSFPIDGTEKQKWLARYAAFAVASGVPAEQAEKAIKAIGERLPILSPDEDAAVLRDAGFSKVELFYAAFSFKGWVGCKL